jgi:hypothetical protein
MKELLRSNDLVLISFVEARLNEAKIAHLVLDGHMSVLEGSVGVLPRRVLVDEDQFAQAERLLSAEGLGHELRSRA